MGIGSIVIFLICAALLLFVGLAIKNYIVLKLFLRKNEEYKLLDDHINSILKLEDSVILDCFRQYKGDKKSIQWLTSFGGKGLLTSKQITKPDDLIHLISSFLFCPNYTTFGSTSMVIDANQTGFIALCNYNDGRYIFTTFYNMKEIYSHDTYYKIGEMAFDGLSLWNRSLYKRLLKARIRTDKYLHRIASIKHKNEIAVNASQIQNAIKNDLSDIKNPIKDNSNDSKNIITPTKTITGTTESNSVGITYSFTASTEAVWAGTGELPLGQPAQIVDTQMLVVDTQMLEQTVKTETDHSKDATNDTEIEGEYKIEYKEYSDLDI